MYRATTPEHTFTLPENANSYEQIQIAYRQGGTSLVKHYKDNTLPDGMTFDGKKVKVVLTQEESKLFGAGSVAIHVRVLTSGGKVYGSQKWTEKVESSNNEDILA